MENKTIAPQKVVSLAYELTLSNGNLADEASADEPLVFIHGIGQTLPAFDERINGLSVGDKFSFSLTSEEGYGETNPNFIVDIPKISSKGQMYRKIFFKLEHLYLCKIKKVIQWMVRLWKSVMKQ